MGGVDLSDQLMNNYHFLRRSCKWWKKLWIHLLNMVIMNSFILNRKFGENPDLSHHEFRESIAKGLLESSVKDVEVNLSHTPHLQEFNASRLKGRHFVTKMSRSYHANRIQPKVCKVCNITKTDQKKGRGSVRQKKTVFMCDICLLPMCAHPCFKIFHMVQNYRGAVEQFLLEHAEG
jgi:hypothetical protein